MTLSHPCDGASGQWYLGNLHCHSTHSDGTLAPLDVARLYADAGYDFLAITDHDVLTLLDDAPLTLLPGVEVSASGPHLLAIGVPKAYDPVRARPAICDEIAADGGLCVLNHPNWEANFSHWPHDQLAACEAAHGLEVYNTIVEVLQGSALATDRWDRLLSAGRRVWGYAHDDLHDPRVAPRAGNVVLAAECTPAALLDSLKAGRCYPSTGLRFEHFGLGRTTLAVAAPGAEHIRFVGRHGAVLQWADASEATYTFAGHEGYVRVECWGGAHRFAFSQPVFVER